MDKEGFEALIRKEIEKLPEEFRKRLENVAFIVMDWPTEEMQKLVGKKGLLLGLYRGVPLPKRGRRYAMVLPDQIIFFQKAIEKVAGSEEKLSRWVQDVVRHEVAHYFGYTDAELIKILNKKR